jgi:hypothetical protein
MNKRGMDTSTLLILITGVIILIVIVPITIQLIELGKESSNLEACKAAVRFAGFKVGLSDNLAVQPLSDVNKVGEACLTSVLIPSQKTETDAIVNQLSNEILNCWDKFGAGKIDFVTPSLKKKILSTTNVCYKCAGIKVIDGLNPNELQKIKIDDVITKVKQDARSKGSKPNVYFYKTWNQFDINDDVRIEFFIGTNNRVEKELRADKENVENLKPIINPELSAFVYVSFLPDSGAFARDPSDQSYSVQAHLPCLNAESINTNRKEVKI